MARHSKTRKPPMRSPLAGAILLALSCTAAAQTLPGGQHNMVGIESIANTTPTTMTIRQSAARARIDWQDFSIGNGYTVQFIQPNSNSVALNRVVGDQQSQILGNLTANGHVFLTNPNGVLFGNGARVDVAGIVASTMQISNAAFDAAATTGSYLFTEGVPVDGATYGGVVATGGSITTRGTGGLIALLGDYVANAGALSAPGGSVVMGGGNRVTLDIGGDGLTNLAIVAPGSYGGLGTVVANSGTIAADGGRVAMHAGGVELPGIIVQSGQVQARSLRNRGGRIELSGDNVRIDVIGSQDASASEAGAAGGGILVSGRQLFVEDDASFDAGGDNAANGSLQLRSQRSLRVMAQAGIDALTADDAYEDDLNYSYIRDQALASALGNDTDVVLTAAGMNHWRSSYQGDVEFLSYWEETGDDYLAHAPRIVKETGGDARLTVNATSSILFDATTIEATVGALDLDANAFSDGRLGAPTDYSYVDGGTIAMAGSAIRTNGGSVRFYGGSDADNGHATGAPTTYGDGISLSESLIDTCGHASDGGCGASAGYIQLRGAYQDPQGYTDGGRGLSIVSSALRTDAGRIDLVGVGHDGAAGVYVGDTSRWGGTGARDVVILADPPGYGEPASIESRSGAISITGTFDAAAATSYVYDAEAAVVIGAATIRTGGDVSIHGRGADLSGLDDQDWWGRADGVLVGGTIEAGQGRTLTITGAAGAPSLNDTTGGVSYAVAIEGGTLRAQGGTIRLGTEAGGFSNDILLGGGASLDTGSASGAGGHIGIAADNVLVTGTARLVATGAGGGSVDIESDGIVAVGADAAIDASATGNGHGGNIRLFGSGGLRAFGDLTARGAGNGDGGLIETSGGALDLRGIGIDASSANGVAGTWLIDPYDVYIVHGNASGSLPGDPFELLADATIQDGDINNAFDSGTSVHITTGAADVGSSYGDIVFSAENGPVEIVRGSGSGHLRFQLDAHGSIRTQAYVDPDSGAFTNGLRIDGGTGPLDVLFNADANDTASSTFAEASISLFGAQILSRGGDVRLFGQGDAANGFARGFLTGINFAESSIDTRGAAGDGTVSMRGMADSLFDGTAVGVAIRGSAIESGRGDIDILGVSYNGYEQSAGVLLGATRSAPGSVIRAGGGAVRIAGVATRTFDDDDYDFGGRGGVVIQAGSVLNDGGSIDVRGFASAGQGGDGDERTVGVALAAGGRIGDADTQHVRVAGEAGGTFWTQAGLWIDGAVGGDIVELLAATANGDVAIRAGTGSTIAATQLLNLRPGGVDGDGDAYERAGDAINLGGSTGFAIDQALLDRLQSPEVVIGSSAQTGLVQVQQSIQRAGNLTLQAGGAGAAGIAVNAGIDVDGHTLALASSGSIVQNGAGAIVADSLLARSTGGDVLLDRAANNVAGNTLAGGAAGDFRYLDQDALAIGSVTAVGFDVAAGAPAALSAAGIDAGNDVHVQNHSGDLTLASGIAAGQRIELVVANTLQNTGGVGLDAGDLWRVWANSWVDETRGGLAGDGPLPNLYNCAYGGPSACGVAASISGSNNQFIYVQQPTATVTIDSHTREYGLDNPAFGYGLDGIILDDIAANAITGSVASAATILSNVGDYTIGGSFVSPAGYAINVLPGVLAITPATLLYVANPYTRIYGDPQGTLGGTVTGFRNDDTLANATSGNLGWHADVDATTSVGNYAITGSGLSAGNYVFAQAAGNATAYRIDPATLFYTANPYTRIYGDPQGALGGSVTGFRNGDTLAGATSGSLVWGADVDATTSVGNYAITGSGLSAGNYVFAQAAGNATAYRIDPATLFYTANPYTRIYGDPQGALGGSVTGFRNGDTLAGATSGSLVWGADVDATTSVGNYAITGSGLSAGNYVLVQAPGNATAYRIDPATLFYVADPYSRLVGQPNGVLTGSVTGFRNGDTLGGATTGTLRFSTDAHALSPAGTYAIEGGGLDATNYVFAQAPGNADALTVLGLTATLFPTDLVRESQDNYLYDRNIGSAPMCAVATGLARTPDGKDGDALSREWSRVKSRPNLTNCVPGNQRNGCDDF
ncbi:filamentous hemagglutinin N-terminal domain-containing protein [Luteimonas sp. BDR2-5]|uniref:MBG domain-containing protein n=1 Tax=Proluteimonas luteida TaxID=2878685 RepID=UPI001E546F7D|nr:MBG domain-containing protein [Luteimonas sp. BDR2-5]MCD9027917.1 filamentous hemagglutinin N-terminal domain-containing protein [Luteimonas sp. BDR2-5]